jgi:diguanylate cyclase (GGDEF)-like protein/PAS domain S-box-containing protein
VLLGEALLMFEVSTPSAEAGADGADYVSALIDGNAFAVFVVDPLSRRIVAANAAANELFGYVSGQLVGRSIHLSLPTWDEDVSSAQVGEPSTLVSFTARAQKYDGQSVVVDVHVRWHESSQTFVVSMQPSRELVNRTDQPESQELVSLLNATLESTADGILAVDVRGVITGINGRFAELWKIPSTVLASHDDAMVMSMVLEQLADPEAFVAKVSELYARPAAESLDILEFRDGRVLERFSRPQLIGDRIVGRVWSFRDITSRRQAEVEAEHALSEARDRAKELHKLALTDPLTGLGNRALFNEVLVDPSTVYVLLLDLEDFKEVNDIHGHQAGDQMLIEVAKRLRHCVRRPDTIARIGGDEFVILLGAGADPDDLAQRIVSVLREPVEVNGVLLRPSLSLGIATRDSHCGTDQGASNLFRRADVAMYEAKRSGKDR